ncbi:MAG TPA: DUF2079 domain-containing protein [Caulifigura sp.]|nr:DUF2079 domain-containing protein [Caulifigura sp.]
MPAAPTTSHPPRSPLAGLIPAVLAVLGMALFWQTVLESDVLAHSLISGQRWGSVIGILGGKVAQTPDGPQVSMPLGPLVVIAMVCGAALLLTGRWLGRRTDDWLAHVLSRISLAWAPAGVWWCLWMATLLFGPAGIASLLMQLADLVVASVLALSAWSVWPPVAAGTPGPGAVDIATISPNRTARWTLAAGMLLYVVVFTAMNWGLWFNLRLPHGDSAMYEEHLWNLEHGKGFRSYLDQGLFLGEHLQVVHVLLVPLHLVFPSHLTLELAQSVILALGAWPLFNLARRHSGSEWAAALLGLAYLAYFPLQYLDIAIDLKTFRPNSFGIPAMLAALDLLERRRYGWASFWLAVTLSSQEDWAIPIALVGAYFAVNSFVTAAPLDPSPRTQPDRSPSSTGEKVAEGRMRGENRRELLLGAALFLFSIIYLWFALNIAIPWFRSGAVVHTASYFSKFGNSPREIITTLVTRPFFVVSTIATVSGLVYALKLLLPIGFLPLRSPARLLVAAPLFLLILMNDLAMSYPAPVHHFHATLIPILFWAAAAGLARSKTRLP